MSKVDLFLYRERSTFPYIRKDPHLPCLRHDVGPRICGYAEYSITVDSGHGSLGLVWQKIEEPVTPGI